jgi:hypothetical protein
MAELKWGRAGPLRIFSPPHCPEMSPWTATHTVQGIWKGSDAQVQHRTKSKLEWHFTKELLYSKMSRTGWDGGGLCKVHSQPSCRNANGAPQNPTVYITPARQQPHRWRRKRGAGEGGAHIISHCGPKCNLPIVSLTGCCLQVKKV